MTEQPLVSVIINCYNGEKYLREAVDSVLAQTYHNWEIVFWDNQSTDSTREIVKSYGDSRIHYFYASEHTPLGEARNLAVEKANGVYINFLDADDVWMPEKLEKQITLLKPGEVETIITGYDIIADEKAKKLPLYAAFMYSRDKEVKSRLSFKDFLSKGPMIVFSSVLFNKTIYQDLGGIDSELEQNEDFDIILKTATKTDIGYLKGYYTLYRIHGNNNSVANGVLGYVENRRIFARFPKTPELEKAIKVNETRIVAYDLMEKKSLKLFLSDIVLKGRTLIFFSLFVKKIVRRLCALTQ